MSHLRLRQLRGETSKKTPGLEDYGFTATVTRFALGGGGDAHVDDDVCPRQVTPPSVVDPFPDGRIVDKSCGANVPTGPSAIRCCQTSSTTPH